ncbi:vWA domain-containing protein [Laceyella putida]|uniref:VWA domain-containing protein n=1 Tax=Laceyella putida TaxID=110101 RepID=A0ABW2RQJ7_9BACL
MKLFRTVLVVLVLPTLLLIACNQKDQAGSPDGKKQEASDQPVPKTFEEIMKQPPGKYAGDKYNQAAVEKELDQMPKEYANDAEKVYSYINSLVSEDYQPLYQKFRSFDPNISVNNATPDGKIEIPRLEQINVEIILDASGSMAGQVSGGQKMDLAKEAVRNFVSSVPKEAKVSLRVYGHKGSNQDKDKQLSCQSSELVYPLSTYNEAQFESALSKFKPTGWTPLARGIEEAQKDLASAQGEGVRNIIYVVSDGIETCGGDPVKAAQQLKDSGIKPVINIVGFDVDDAGQRQLKQVASAADGVYKSVNSASDLKEYLEAEKERVKSEWESWALHTRVDAGKEWGKKRVELHSVHGKLVSLRLLEMKHMRIARDYLERQDIIKSDIRKQLTELISDRDEVVGNTLRERSRELADTLKQIEKQVKVKANETRDKNLSTLD